MDVNKNSKILLIGASTQSAVYVAKQYKKFGLHVSVVDWHNVPIKYSKYIDCYYNIGSPLYDLDCFVNELTKLIKTEQFTCVLPIHDPAVQVCEKYHERISKLTKIIGLNSEEIQSFATDKWKLIKLANQLGIKTPLSFLISNENDLTDILNQIKYPCVVKPKSSSVIINNKVLELSVRFAYNQSELVDIIREYILITQIIIQEFLEGYGIGYNIISQEGKVVNQYIHCRINENHGVSTYRMTLPIETFNLTQLVIKLVENMGWTGVAMVEFRISNGVPYLMEMNGRFWGSIDLGIRSGLNYPVLLYEMQILNKKITTNIAYKLIKVRNLHEEILYFSTLLVKGKFKRFCSWLYELLFKCKNSYIEDNFFDDPKFVFQLYLKDIKRIYNKRLSTLLLFRRKVFHLPKDYDKKIAFICAGNICRSPFAEQYARKKLHEYKFYSFGTIPLENRKSPVNAVIAAIDFGIEMDDLLSKTISNDVIKEIDYFIVMDKINYTELIKRGINKNQIYFLSSDEITDPYMKDLSQFRKTYKLIATHIDNLSN